MAQARTEATLASTGGGGASGIWGISDATGTYTFLRAGSFFIL